jgi:hypothetical protein
MLLAQKVVLMLLLFSVVAQTMRTALRTLELKGSSVEFGAPPTCPLGNPAVKNYYFEFTVFAENMRSLAVHLLRDPADPHLTIYQNAVWTLSQEVDSRRRPVGAHKMIPVSGNGTWAEGVTYRLDDIKQLKLGICHLELVTKCGTGRANYRDLSWGGPRSSLAINSNQSLLPSGLETRENGSKCSTKFFRGKYYQKSLLEQALKKRMRKSTGSTIRFPASEVRQFRRIAPSIAKAIFGPLLAGIVGYVAPLWFASETGLDFNAIVSGASVLGSLVPATLLVGKKQRLNQMTGMQKLFEKLYCLSRGNTCRGQPCLKVCENADKQIALIPFSQEPQGGILC